MVHHSFGEVIATRMDETSHPVGILLPRRRTAKTSKTV
jgi:hypothetical protein